ncbi:MAG: hypothetical protein EBX40_06950 [Gammaproteobacteria bacterium]|nr:hypothetical protein [Gammaproteobacteria bacterium]
MKVMFSLPDELVSRIRTLIPLRERSGVVASLLENELSLREKALYQSAKELESHKGLKKEMGAWEDEFGGDGLNDI